MRRRCQRNSVSAVTSHPARLGRGSAAAIAPSKLRSASVISGRSTCRRSTPSWWRKTMISRSFERPDRTVSRASDARNRYKIRYTTNQHRPASRQVNDHGRVSGTHRAPAGPEATPPCPRTDKSAHSPSSCSSSPPSPAAGSSSTCFTATATPPGPNSSPRRQPLPRRRWSRCQPLLRRRHPCLAARGGPGRPRPRWRRLRDRVA